MTFNQVVRGSRPRRPTTFLTNIISKKWFSPISPNPKTRADICGQTGFCGQIADKLRTNRKERYGKVEAPSNQGEYL